MAGGDSSWCTKVYASPQITINRGGGGKGEDAGYRYQNPVYSS